MKATYRKSERQRDECTDLKSGGMEGEVYEDKVDLQVILEGNFECAK